MGKKRPSESTPVTTDPRFAQILTDPRFRTAPAHVQQFTADERFSSMFTDKTFQGPAPSKVDARGKPIKSVKNPLAKLYQNSQTGGCLDEDGKFHWEEVSSSDSEEVVIDDETKDQAEFQVWEEPENVPLGQPSTRIAVMNCDWKAIHAVDLLALFRSFCPEGGTVTQVSLYPSSYGYAKMSQEDVEGPGEEIFDPEKEGGMDELKVRKYELDRMKYYYAVADFDSVSTAEAIYDVCEGLEIERTSNVLDLRYVPDSLSAFEHPPKETADSVPKNYSLKDFFTRALQHSRVQLTWDETPLDRTQELKKAFTEEDMEKMDLNQYLAPLSSDEEEPAPSEPAENEDSHEKKPSFFNRTKKDDIDLEITFNTAFDEMAENAAKEVPKDESTWDKHIREKTEKKKKTHSQKLKEKWRAEKKSKKEKETLSLLVNDDPGAGSFEFDPEDKRFKPIFDDPQYAVDPTHPKFKRDADSNQTLLSVQRKKRKVENS